MDERARRKETLRKFYRGLSATVLFGGIPIFVLGSGFAGGFGSALDSFRMGLAGFNPLNLVFLLPLLLLPAYWWLGREGATRTKIGWRVIITAACAFGAFLVTAQIEDTPVEELPIACHRGAYRLEDGRIMAVSISPVAALNFDLSDGTRVMTWGGGTSFSGTSCIGTGAGRDDFLMEAPSCPAETLRVKTHDASEQGARRLAVRTIVADFTSSGVDFKARLFLPPAGKPVPLLVLPAWRDGVSRLDWGHFHYIAAGLGFAVFVYDNPGGWPDGLGEIETDDEALAHAAAALARARALAGERISKVGFYGDEDALLAITGTKADFAVIDSEELETKLLHKARVPVLWLLPSLAGGRSEVLARTALQKLGQGHRVSLAVMPGADKHLAFYQSRSGEHCSVNWPPSYVPTILRWLESLERASLSNGA